VFQEPRRRLAIYYTSVTAVILLIFASCFYGYVHTTLVERVDDTLGHVAEIVERSLVLEWDPSQSTPKWSFHNQPDTLEDDHIDLEWFDPDEHLLWSTFPQEYTYPFQLGGHTVPVPHSSSYWLRQLTQPVRIQSQLIGYLRVSHPWFEVSKPTRQLVVDLALGISVTLSLLAASGWFLAGLAMQPVRESYQHLKQFTADASHELRSPLAALQTNIQVTLSHPHLDPETQHTCQVMERLVQRLSRLVDDLLFLARQEGGILPRHSQCCDLDALLVLVLEEQEPLAQQKGIHVKLEIADTPSAFSLVADEDHLVRLINNLLWNAIQHTPAQGTITLLLERIQQAGASWLRLQVKDTGVGIPAAAIPHLFERFYRVERQQEGSGLGLAIVKSIVESYHGHITVESQVNQGSCFTVLLPVQDCGQQ
jgi:OmpR-family two-component system manganese-sensing sensor histidine kinase